MAETTHDQNIKLSPDDRTTESKGGEERIPLLPHPAQRSLMNTSRIANPGADPARPIPTPKHPASSPPTPSEGAPASTDGGLALTDAKQPTSLTSEIRALADAFSELAKALVVVNTELKRLTPDARSHPLPNVPFRPSHPIANPAHEKAGADLTPLLQEALIRNVESPDLQQLLRQFLLR